MSRVDAYRAMLVAGRDPVALVLAESGLPGPRGNLELIAALAASADEATLIGWSSIPASEAPGDQPMVVLVCGGVMGLGRFLDGRPDILEFLHARASDPRWRVREAVAMAFQEAGRDDPGALVGLLGPWQDDADPLVQRAVVAALCEPALLRDPAVAARVVGVVARITDSLLARMDRRDPDVRVLRQALGYGWSVSMVAAPVAGTAAFDQLADRDDPDARWIVRENLAKSRMQRLDAAWLAAVSGRAAGSPGG